MSKPKKIIINIQRLLRYDKLDALMFGYVMGVKILPSVTTRKAIEMFMSDFNLTEDDYPLDCAISQFSRMFESYRDFRN
jgi:hypothetical protein